MRKDCAQSDYGAQYWITLQNWHDRALIIQVIFMNAEWTSPQLHLSMIIVISLVTYLKQH